MTGENAGRNQNGRTATTQRRDSGDASVTRREDVPQNLSRECHRRGCDEPARFLVLERYLEETGQGAVEAKAALCRGHTAEESPVNLEDAYENYIFRVEPIESAE
jgi:hypothetical protein